MYGFSRLVRAARNGRWARCAARTAREFCVAHNRHRAITDAKADRAIGPAECDRRVGANIDAGKRIGVRGAPTLIAETGDLMGDHIPYVQLVRVLKRR